MNYISIDLESFIHMDVLNQEKNKKEKDNGYIKKSINEILEILKKNNTIATFFVVSEIYDWYPELIEKIESEGHEIGWHTHTHRKLLNKSILEAELILAKKFLKRFKPKGFRAPQMYLKKTYLKILKENGFSYDSSIYGGMPFFEEINEIPIQTIRKIKIRFPSPLTMKLLLKNPVGCGLIFAIQGHRMNIKGLKKLGKDHFFFFHPWQITKIPRAYKIKQIFKDFRMAFYLLPRKRALETLLQKHSFFSYIKYIQKQQLK